MTAEDFRIFWGKSYSNIPPISHYFKYYYPDRWFRIHSLPGSKRYADTLQEWKILLDRQNSILDELLENGSNFLLVTGDHHWEGNTELHPLSDVSSIKEFSFIPLEHIDLHKFSPENYEDGQMLEPMFTEQIWRQHAFDNILKDIADDYLRALFVSVHNDCLVAPYDGGIDLIFKDTETRDIYKDKYKDWLPAGEDGL